MELPLSLSRKMKVDGFDTRRLLLHAARQAVSRNYDRFPIVDVDSHHYETDKIVATEVVNYIEDPVIRQLAEAGSREGNGLSLIPGSVLYQDMGGRITRYPLRRMEAAEVERTTSEPHRDIDLSKRWMDALGIDINILFPSVLLDIGFHPQVEVEVALCRAYNRWLVEHVLVHEPRIRSMLVLPLNDPDAAYRMVEEFGGRPGVVGFMVTSTRTRPVYDNAFMKTYSALEERGLPLAFHGGYMWNHESFNRMNRFISVHSLGFVFHNMVHLTNWIFNALPERFPKLNVIWIESGLAWVPFMMQRMDSEYKMRVSDAPGLKRLPSEYIRDMYFASQPMEVPDDLSILETTFRMIGAETQLLYSSDYPHWDFDMPSTIYDLPFLSEEAKHNILGGNALRLFGIELPAGKLADPMGVIRAAEAAGIATASAAP